MQVQREKAKEERRRNTVASVVHKQKTVKFHFQDVEEPIKEELSSSEEEVIDIDEEIKREKDKQQELNAITALKASNFQLKRIQNFLNMQMSSQIVRQKPVEKDDDLRSDTDSESFCSSSEEVDDGTGDWRNEGVKKKKKKKSVKDPQILDDKQSFQTKLEQLNSLLIRQMTHDQLKEINQASQKCTTKVKNSFIQGTYDDKLSVFIEEIINIQIKQIDTKIDRLNNKEIHFLTKQELINKIDLIVFSDFYAKQGHELEQKKDVLQVAATQMNVKAIAKNLKERYSKGKNAPPVPKQEKKEDVQKTDQDIQMQFQSKTVEELQAKEYVNQLFLKHNWIKKEESKQRDQKGATNALKTSVQVISKLKNFHHIGPEFDKIEVKEDGKDCPKHNDCNDNHIHHSKTKDLKSHPIKVPGKKEIRKSVTFHQTTTDHAEMHRLNLAFFFKDKSQKHGLKDEHNHKGLGLSIHDIQEVIHGQIFPIDLTRVKRSEFDQYVMMKQQYIDQKLARRATHRKEVRKNRQYLKRMKIHDSNTDSSSSDTSHESFEGDFQDQNNSIATQYSKQKSIKQKLEEKIAERSKKIKNANGANQIHDLQKDSKQLQGLLNILTKDPRLRSKNEIDKLKTILFTYLDEILFKQVPLENKYKNEQSHKKQQQQKRIIEKFTTRNKEEIITQLLTQTLKLVTVKKNQRFVNFDENISQIKILLKGNCLIRIPYDNLKRRMTIRQYFQYIQDNKNESDPLYYQDKVNHNCVFDYNLQNKDVIKIKEEHQNREIQKIRDQKLKEMIEQNSKPKLESNVVTNRKNQSMKEEQTEKILESHHHQDSHEEEHKKNYKLQRVQTALDSDQDLNKLKQFSMLQKRNSLISKEMETQIKKHQDDQLIAQTKAAIRENLLGKSFMKNHQSIELEKIEARIEALYNKVYEFKFKSLRPWVVLSAGDCINSQNAISTSEKQCENVQYGGRLITLPPPDSSHPNENNNDQGLLWPRSLISIDSLGNLYSKWNQHSNFDGHGKNRLSSFKRKSDSDSSFQTSEDSDDEDEHVHMMVIDQSILTSIFSTIVLKNLHDEMGLLRKFPFMQSFGKATLQKVINKLEKQELNKDHILYKQGDEFQYVYLLIYGTYKQSWSLIADKRAPDGQIKQYQKQSGSNNAAAHEFLINKQLPAEDDQEVSMKEKFNTVGLEESLIESKTYLTTLRCEQPSGEVTDPYLIEMYENILNIQPEFGQPKRKCLQMNKGIVFKIQKDVFFKIVVQNRNTTKLETFVQSKLQFLNKRIMFLAAKDYAQYCFQLTIAPKKPKERKQQEQLQQEATSEVQTTIDQTLHEGNKKHQFAPPSALGVENFSRIVKDPILYKVEFKGVVESKFTKMERLNKEEQNNELIAKTFKEKGIQEIPELTDEQKLIQNPRGNKYSKSQKLLHQISPSNQTKFSDKIQRKFTDYENKEFQQLMETNAVGLYSKQQHTASQVSPKVTKLPQIKQQQSKHDSNTKPINLDDNKSLGSVQSKEQIKPTQKQKGVNYEEIQKPTITLRKKTLGSSNSFLFHNVNDSILNQRSSSHAVVPKFGDIHTIDDFNKAIASEQAKLGTSMTMDEAHSIQQKYSDRVDKNIKKLLSNYMDKNNSLFYTKDLGNPNNRQRVHASLKRVQRNKWVQRGNHSSLEITNDTSLVDNSIMTNSNQMPINIQIGQQSVTNEYKVLPKKKESRSNQKLQALSYSFSMNQLSNHQQFLPKLKTIKPLNLENSSRFMTKNLNAQIPLKSERIIPTKNPDLQSNHRVPIYSRRNSTHKGILRHKRDGSNGVTTMHNSNNKPVTWNNDLNQSVKIAGPVNLNDLIGNYQK